ncbi:MAG: ABC transporter permease [Candidatus Nanopelagicales bacterium]
MVPKTLQIFAVLVVLLAGIPLVYLLIRATQSGLSTAGTVLLREKTLSTITTTISLAVLVALLSAVIGISSAWLIQRTNLPMSALFMVLGTLALAIPSYVSTYSWIALVPNFAGFSAAVFILTLTCAPYILLAAYAALRRIDATQEESARALGLSATQVTRRVIWPQARPTVLASVLLVMLYVLSDFGAVSLLRVDTFTRVVHTMYRATYDRSAAAVVAVALVMLAAVLIYAEQRSRCRAVAAKSGLGSIRTANKIDLGWKKYLAASYLLLLAGASVGVPGYVLVTRFITVSADIDVADLLAATIATLTAALAGAVLAMVFAIPLGVLAARYKSRLSSFAEYSILLTHALPGVVIGLALVALGSRLGFLYQTLPLLAFSYAVLFLAKAVGTTRSSIARIPRIYDDVSRSLGYTNWQTIRKVTIPIAAPGVITGFLLVLLTAMKELPATLMLRPTGFDTLAIEIWTKTSISQYGQAAPYALLLVLIAAIPTYLLSRPDRASTEEARENTAL